MFDKIRLKKGTTITDTYAAFHYRYILVSFLFLVGYTFYKFVMSNSRIF